MMTTELWNPTTFDALRRQLIPSFDLLYDTAASAVALSVPAAPRILDLGAGTGLLSAVILDRIPDAEMVLVDRSEGMLQRAIDRFELVTNVTTVVSDLMDPLPVGPFDAVVSALAIHHLPDHDKRRLFGRVRQVLGTGGLFVNVEQVLAPTERIEAMYDYQHERHVLISRTPADEWTAGRERMKHDICTDVDSQVGWLREAGFGSVDCLAKDWRFATYAAWVDR
jgi:tRNA (cmo5U34)-methyltransferase